MLTKLLQVFPKGPVEVHTLCKIEIVKCYIFYNCNAELLIAFSRTDIYQSLDYCDLTIFQPEYPRLQRSERLVLVPHCDLQANEPGSGQRQQYAGKDISLPLIHWD